MNDLKNILNYFGEYWRLERDGIDYAFSWGLKQLSYCSFTWENCIYSKTPEGLSAKIHKIINECAIKPKKLIKGIHIPGPSTNPNWNPKKKTKGKKRT